jgi:hypothetical protein
MDESLIIRPNDFWGKRIPFEARWLFKAKPLPMALPSNRVFDP